MKSRRRLRVLRPRHFDSFQLWWSNCIRRVFSASSFLCCTIDISNSGRSSCFRCAHNNGRTFRTSDHIYRHDRPSKFQRLHLLVWRGNSCGHFNGTEFFLIWFGTGFVVVVGGPVRFLSSTSLSVIP